MIYSRSSLTHWIVALVVPIGLAIAANVVWFPLTIQRVDLTDGQRTFNNHCASCHGLSSTASGMGPSLANIGAEASRRVPGQSATEYLFASIVDPDAFLAGDGVTKMPEGFADALSQPQLRNLVGFLAAQGDQPDFHAVMRLQKPVGDASQGGSARLDAERIESGRKLFFGKFQCGQCHAIAEPIAGETLFAPTLRGIGIRSPDFLRSAIRNPSGHVFEPYRQYQGLTIDGQVVAGRLLSQTEKVAVLLQRGADGSPKLQKLELDELEPDAEGRLLVPSSVSPMPQWSEKEMSDQELGLLIEFLTTLR